MKKHIQEELLAGVYFIGAFTAYGAGLNKWVFWGFIAKGVWDTLCCYKECFKEILEDSKT